MAVGMSGKKEAIEEAFPDEAEAVVSTEGKWW